MLTLMNLRCPRGGRGHTVLVLGAEDTGLSRSWLWGSPPGKGRGPRTASQAGISSTEGSRRRSQSPRRGGRGLGETEGLGGGEVRRRKNKDRRSSLDGLVPRARHGSEHPDSFCGSEPRISITLTALSGVVQALPQGSHLVSVKGLHQVQCPRWGQQVLKDRSLFI